MVDYLTKQKAHRAILVTRFKSISTLVLVSFLLFTSYLISCCENYETNIQGWKK